MSCKKNIAIYPGTFDPITNGHLDIIKRSAEIFERVIVACANNAGKKPMFDLDSRLDMIRLAVCGVSNVQVVGFDCLLADFARKNGVCVLVRGLRAVSDFEYELQMGYSNTSLNENLETIYFMPHLQNAFISSSIVRSIIAYSGDFSHLVPKSVSEFILSKKALD